MASAWRKDEYRGVACYICTRPWLRLLLFGTDVLACQFGQGLYFRDEEFFLDEKIKKHEYFHVLQRRREGFLFHFKWIYFNLKYGYEKNPYEIEARTYSGL